MKKYISLTLCLVLCGLALAGCAGGEPFEAREYTAGAAQVQQVCLDVSDRQIQVQASQDGQIHISYFENSEEAYDISLSGEQVLTMTNAASQNYIGVKPAAENRTIVLQVPSEHLKSLTISTTNEDISLSALAVKETISLSANGGGITFEPLGVGSALSLTVKNGDIEGAVAGSEADFSIQTEIKKGESNLPGSTGGGRKTLQVASNNGDVNIAFAGR